MAKPYARELMLERFTPQRVAARAQHEARNYASMIAELPYQVHDVLQEVRDGQIEVGFRHQGLDDLIKRMDIVFNRLGIAMVAVGGAVTSAILAAIDRGRASRSSACHSSPRSGSSSRRSSASGWSGASSAPAACSRRAVRRGREGEPMQVLLWWRRRMILRAWRRGTIDYAQARWRYERLARGL